MVTRGLAPCAAAMPDATTSTLTATIMFRMIFPGMALSLKSLNEQ
jgi:hypothetical protein